LDTLLDDVTGKLVLRVSNDLSSDDGDDIMSVFGSAVLDEMLCNVVTELVDDEVRTAVMEFL
jgi:hypothetical protein